MSDPIQRFTADANHAYRDNVFGGYVLYADHVAALARAVEHRDALHATSNSMAYKQGQRDIFAFHAEWTVTGMCKPDCLPCQRLDELIAERHAGWKEGQQDALASLDNAEVWGRIMRVLNDNGINTQDGSIHSWRCFDKERYPEPCSCAAELVVEIIEAVKGDG
jgi:hypothetical protein